jgi:hypothetical protein
MVPIVAKNSAEQLHQATDGADGDEDDLYRFFPSDNLSGQKLCPFQTTYTAV